jgi:hypothetical protein
MKGKQGGRGGNEIVLMLVLLSTATGLAASHQHFEIPQTTTFSWDVFEQDSGLFRTKTVHASTGGITVPKKQSGSIL